MISVFVNKQSFIMYNYNKLNENRSQHTHEKKKNGQIMKNNNEQNKK